jgi:flavorubredoxin
MLAPDGIPRHCKSSLCDESQCFTGNYFQKRRVAVMENGSWAPTACRVMRGMLEGMKEIDIVEPMVTIRSRMKDSDVVAMEQLATALLA